MLDDCFSIKLKVASIFEFYLTVFEYISMRSTFSTLV